MNSTYNMADLPPTYAELCYTVRLLTKEVKRLGQEVEFLHSQLKNKTTAESPVVDINPLRFRDVVRCDSSSEEFDTPVETFPANYSHGVLSPAAQNQNIESLLEKIPPLDLNDGCESPQGDTKTADGSFSEYVGLGRPVRPVLSRTLSSGF